MSEPSTFKKIEIIGTSPESFDKAVENGVRKASATVRNMRWFEVTEMRGRIDGDSVGEFQVAMKIGIQID